MPQQNNNNNDYYYLFFIFNYNYNYNMHRPIYRAPYMPTEGYRGAKLAMPIC